MKTAKRTWALVLAAGDGTRLASLTTDSRGHAIPKQFCSLNGGTSLLQDALTRGRSVAPRERLCAIVSASHEHYWSRSMTALPRENIFVQPRNCGTANGILLAVLRILERDPLADIVFLPSDHFVRDESGLADALRASIVQLARSHDALVMIGITPDEADPELGYIVPHGTGSDGAQGVRKFVEKPAAENAAELIRAGALWNSFIFAARGTALLAMLREQMPTIAQDMATAIALDSRRDTGAQAGALQKLYDTLPSVDFSRAIVQQSCGRLKVVTAPACGWSDLGTPARVVQALRRLDAPQPARRRTPAHGYGFINLAMQHAQLSLAS